MDRNKIPGTLAAAGGRNDCTKSGTNKPAHPSAQARSVYVVKLRPEPGIDAIKALRALLKRALRTHRSRALSVEEERL
jgi:hypothetical protein